MELKYLGTGAKFRLKEDSDKIYEFAGAINLPNGKTAYLTSRENDKTGGFWSYNGEKQVFTL
jgi:hypothetical protein